MGDKATLTNDLSADDLAEIIGPRKAVYKRALRQPVCPLLVDSRCRILQPDPPQHKEGEELEEGTLIGAAISPGITTGRVRIVHDPDGKFEQGEVLCAVVTGPAWTPVCERISSGVADGRGPAAWSPVCKRIRETCRVQHQRPEGPEGWYDGFCRRQYGRCEDFGRVSSKITLLCWHSRTC